MLCIQYVFKCINVEKIEETVMSSKLIMNCALLIHLILIKLRHIIKKLSILTSSFLTTRQQLEEMKYQLYYVFEFLKTSLKVFQH